MTTNKGVNRTFLITFLIYVGGSFLWSLIGKRFVDSFYVDIAVSQLLVCVPPFVYLKISGTKTGELIPYKKIRISDALLAVVMTYLFYPLMLVMNLLTMFFVDNTSAELATTMGQENPHTSIAIPQKPALLALTALQLCVVSPLVEEFVFRGVFYQTYRKSSMKAALVLSGLLFGCMHMNFNQFLYTFVFGMILVFMMEATGSIVTSMICHFLLNLNGVLLSGLNGSIRNASVSDAVQQSSNLASQPKILLAGLLVWGVIAVFTTAGGCAIWVHLARKNGRLELIQQKMNEAKRERIITPTLVIGMVLAVAFMVVFEIY